MILELSFPEVHITIAILPSQFLKLLIMVILIITIIIIIWSHVAKMADVGDEEIIDEDEEETEDRTADNESPSTNQHLELLPLENFKSPIWNHFGFPAKDGRFVDEKGKRKHLL